MKDHVYEKRYIDLPNGPLDVFVMRLYEAANGFKNPIVLIDDYYEDKLIVGGWRPMTEEEKKLDAKLRAKEAEREAKRKLKVEQNERKEYERLKKKFEGT
jgi:hypothetical protein